MGVVEYGFTMVTGAALRRLGMTGIRGLVRGGGLERRDGLIWDGLVWDGLISGGCLVWGGLYIACSTRGGTYYQMDTGGSPGHGGRAQWQGHLRGYILSDGHRGVTWARRARPRLRRNWPT